MTMGRQLYAPRVLGSNHRPCPVCIALPLVMVAAGEIDLPWRSKVRSAWEAALDVWPYLVVACVMPVVNGQLMPLAYQRDYSKVESWGLLQGHTHALRYTFRQEEDENSSSKARHPLWLPGSCSSSDACLTISLLALRHAASDLLNDPSSGRWAFAGDLLQKHCCTST